MGTIYAFTSKSKPWVKLGQTINCPIGRIEDYNGVHGTDFDANTLVSWEVPDCICLLVEQEVHSELESNDFDRVRKGSANEIFTFAGRKDSDFIELVRRVSPEVLYLDNRNWAVFLCPDCGTKLSAPQHERLKVTCPKCHNSFVGQFSL
jgi:NADH pyrophosphatase NudC (nudix superfamily)